MDAKLLLNVVIDGRSMYAGHKNAWRFGQVIRTHKNDQFVVVECQPRGRERKIRRLDCPKCWLLLDTPALRKALIGAGIEVPATLPIVARDPSSPALHSTARG